MTRVIFLSGIFEFSFLMEYLSNSLTEMGYGPNWYRKKTPILDNDALKACLENVKHSDRFIFILGKKYGFKLEGSRYSITEELISESILGTINRWAIWS